MAGISNTHKVISNTHKVIGLEFRKTDVGVVVKYRLKGAQQYRQSSGANIIKVTACDFIEVSPTGELLASRKHFGQTLHSHEVVPLCQALGLMPLIREIQIRDVKRREEMKRKADKDTMKETLRQLENATAIKKERIRAATCYGNSDHSTETKRTRQTYTDCNQC